MNQVGKQTDQAVSNVVLEGHELSKSFGKGRGAVSAVESVSLRLSEGEFIAIVGASGSGKTTLINLLSGLERPDSGQVQVAGQDLSAASDAEMTRSRLRHIGVVFQTYNLMPTLSALDNVAMPLLLAGTRRRLAREKALQKLQDVGLAERSRSTPAQISGGEQQRVALARAMIHDPSIVFADEPTGSLDRVNSRAVTQVLRETVAAQNRAVVMVT
ncbi:MAG: ABC transporter ATP-binding protein, partial [Planctomycetota bacterium]